MQQCAIRATNVEMHYVVIVMLLALCSCDQLSQRIWNCSVDPLPVTRVLDTGERFPDEIKGRSYIASMKGGVQVLALESGLPDKKSVIWRREQSKTGLAESADQICNGAKSGVVAEQF